MNCSRCSTHGCLTSQKQPGECRAFSYLRGTSARWPRDIGGPFPHISCHILPPPPVICETPRHAPPFPSYRCHFAHLRACFPRLSTHPQAAPLMLHYQRFSTLINPPQFSCHGSSKNRTNTRHPPQTTHLCHRQLRSIPNSRVIPSFKQGNVTLEGLPTVHT